MHALVMRHPADDAAATAVEQRPEPVPGPGEIGIEVARAGVNFLDVMARRGDPGYADAWPYVPGMEVAGRVGAVGSGVTGFAVGDRVAAFTGSGGFAEVAVTPAASAVPIPDGVDDDVAAAAPAMLSTAMLLLTDVGRLGEGESVLAHSASGGVGTAVAAIARALGARRLVGTVGRRDKIDGALAAGWDAAVAREDMSADTVRAAAGGALDVVLDPLGTRFLDLDLDVVAPGGRIALFGNPSGEVPAPLPPLGRLIGGNVALAGFSISRLAATAPQRAARALGDVLGLVADGRLTPAVSVVDGLAELSGVHDLLAAGRGEGKYVVAVS